jgi:uncharacterized coiled-coil protein SlyX
MADTGDPTRFIPWLLMALGAVGTTLWAAVKSSRKAENDAKKELTDAIAAEKDKRIAVLEAEKARLENTVKELGDKLDVKNEQMLRIAGAVSRARRDPTIPNEFEDEYPSAVKYLADIVDPKSRTTEERQKDPELDALLNRFNESTPPKLEVPRPRGKMPSRPR